MSAAASFNGHQAPRNEASASGRGAAARKRFALVVTEPDIPRIPHIPRNGHSDPAESGNVGKEGKPSGVSRPDQIDLRRVLVGLGAQVP